MIPTPESPSARVRLRRRMQNVTGFLLLIVVAFSAVAQNTYYVDPQGSDNNSGRTPGAAWATVRKVNGTSYGAGDQVLFRSGCVWREQLTVTSSGEAGRPLVFSSYGTGDRPCFEALDDLAGWQNPGGWSDEGGNIWAFHSQRHPGRLWLSNAEYPVSGSGAGGSSTPDPVNRWYDDGNGTLLVYCEANPATVYTSIRVADAGRGALVASNVSNVTFRNLAFTGGNTCAYLSGARYLAIDSCVVGPGVSRYALMATNASDHGLMRASRIDRLDPVVHAFQYGGDASGGNGQDCIAFQAASDWEITGCVIADPGHSGINISGEVGPGRYSCRNFIHHNEFLMRKADYGRAVDLQADAVGYCSDNLIYANYIHNHSVRSQLLGDHNVFCYNIIDTTRHCPYEADAERGGGIGILDYLLCQNNGVYNNVITNCDGPAITLVESESCHDNRIVNNICVNNGLVGGAKPGLQHVEFWSWGLYSQANNEILNNVFYNANDPNPVIYHNGPTGRHISVAALNATASNGDVAAWNMSTNPMLAAGFRPLQASPVVNAGKDVGLSRDFAGDPIGAPPNIGAFEKASGTTTDLIAHPAPELPASPSLEQNYPNPFNPTTTIGFVLASAGHVALKVFNTLGQEVATLVSQALPAGRYQRSWTAANLPSGLYFYRLQTAASTFTREMLLVK